MVALTIALVDIASPTGSEVACARFLRDWFRDRGIRAVLQHLESGRAHNVAPLGGGRRGPTRRLNGHLDTSSSGDDHFDYPGLGVLDDDGRPQGRLHGDAVLGLGAFNMKGGLAAAALALVELARGPALPGRVLFAGLCGESEKAPVRGASGRPRLGPAYRGRGVGARRFLRRAGRIDWAVVAGPSAMRIVNAQAGSLFIEIAICGRAAYLGRRGPTEEGALEVAAALIPTLGRWGEVTRARRAIDTGLGRLEPGLTVGAIEGGWPFAPGVSPAVCHVFVDLRVAPGQSSARVVGEFRRVLERFASRHRSVEVGARVFARGRGSMTPADHPLVRAAAQVLEHDLGRPAGPFPVGSADASNDTNHFRRHGIPSIKVGPGTAGDGAPPRAPVADLVGAQQLYVRLARRLVTPGGPA